MDPNRAGWVLTGGDSSRMGRDKALLPWNGSTFVETIAQAVRSACGNVTLVGRPERYQSLGLPVIADVAAGFGPLGGLLTVLQNTSADWNLLVACDMPSITSEFLRRLLEKAEAEGADCLIPCTPRGLEPLCAVYHRRVLPVADWGIRHKMLRMQEFTGFLERSVWQLPAGIELQNLNRPEDFT
jgi:molybdopterin-guanine dinucleotide biosynthesis protein A